MGTHRATSPHLAKSALCILLLMNPIGFSGGCGATGLPLADGWLRTGLPSNDPLVAALAGKGFTGAKTIDFNSASGEFEIGFADASLRVRGSFRPAGAAQRVASLEFARGGLSARFEIDAQYRITRIATNTSLQWRPEWPSLDGLPTAPRIGLDGFMAANQQLLTLARFVDESRAGPPGTSATPTPPSSQDPTPAVSKLANASQDTSGQLSSILGTLAVILGIQAAIAGAPAVYFVFQVLVALNLLSGQFQTTQTSAVQSVVDGDATLRVTNSLSGDVPIWYVVLIEDQSAGLPGGNLLGEEAIPAGESRDFAVPAGKRNLNIIIPYGADCYYIHHVDAEFSTSKPFEFALTDTYPAEIYPPDCTSG